MDDIIGKEIAEDYFGKDTANYIYEHLNTISPEFNSFLHAAVGSVYSQEILDQKTKCYIVLSSLISQRDTKFQLSAHLKAALNNGISKQEILAMILHLTLYVGFPATINALNIAKEVFDGIAKS